MVIDDVSTVFTAAFPPGMESRGGVGGSGSRGTNTKKASTRRFSIVTALVTELGRLAATRDVVVLVCQQMTTRVVMGYGGVLQPCVGTPAWSSGLATRLLVTRRETTDSGVVEEGDRWVRVLKTNGRSWEESCDGPIVRVRIGKNTWRDVSPPPPPPIENVGNVGNVEVEAVVGVHSSNIQVQSPWSIPSSSQPRTGGNLTMRKPPSISGRKRNGMEAGVIPDSDASSSDGDFDKDVGEELFGCGDDGITEIGEKGVEEGRNIDTDTEEEAVVVEKKELPLGL